MQRQPLPGWREVDRLALVGDGRAARHLLHDVGQQPLGQIHHAVVVDISLVKLDLGELRVVLEAHPFVAKVAPYLIDGIVHPDQQPLEIQLKADPQVEVLVKLVVVGDKRPGRRPAIERLQDRRFDFQKALAIQEAAQRADHPRPLAEDLAHIRVHGQIGVPLAVAGLLVAEGPKAADRAVSLYLLLDNRQRADRLGQQPQLIDLDGNLPGARAHHDPTRLDEIVQLDELVLDQRIGGLPYVVQADHQLHPAAAILNVPERHLALDIDPPHAPAHGDFNALRRLRIALHGLISGDGSRCRMGALHAGRVRLYPQLAQTGQLLQPVTLHIRRFPGHRLSRFSFSTAGHIREQKG